MTSLADRLRALSGTPGSRAGVPGVPSPAPLPGRSSSAVASGAALVLGGEVRERDGRTFVVVDRTLPLDAVHGRARLGDTARLAACVCDAFPVLAAVEPPTGAGRANRLLYFDLETTGLAGGAGTHAFLVGCAWFEPDAVRTRQYVMTGFGDEPAMLDAVTDEVREVGALVTYNGRTFDVPLIDMRYQFHRRSSPFEGLAHLDMLHVARRLWRGEEDEAAGTPASCALGVLEATMCGVRRMGDVPGAEIPARYFQFVRTGDAGPLAPVLEHNRLDLLSLAVLTARALHLVRAGAGAAGSVRECAGLGRVFERAGRLEAALDCYGRAGGLLDGIPRDEGGMARAEALRRYATICRRRKRFADAAAAWERALALRRCPPHIRREASEALAVHYEHRARDLESARRFALGAMLPGVTDGRTEAVRHRLARLDRKMSSRQGDLPGSRRIPEEREPDREA